MNNIIEKERSQILGCTVLLKNKSFKQKCLLELKKIMGHSSNWKQIAKTKRMIQKNYMLHLYKIQVLNMLSYSRKIHYE